MLHVSLQDIFHEHYSFSDFFSKLCRALRGRLVRKGPQSCLGQEMKADIRSGASFLKPWAPGLPCTDPRFHRGMQQHALLWCISKSLDLILGLGRNHCTGLSIATAMIHCELLPILILVSIEDDKEPLVFSSSWRNLQLAPRNVSSLTKGVTGLLWGSMGLLWGSMGVYMDLWGHEIWHQPVLVHFVWVGPN